MGIETIAEVAQVPRTTVYSLCYGNRGFPPSKRISAKTADKLVSCPFVPRPYAVIDGKATWRLIDELKAYGLPSYRIAAALLGREPDSRRHLELHEERVTALNARRVRKLHDMVRKNVPDFRDHCNCTR